MLNVIIKRFIFSNLYLSCFLRGGSDEFKELYKLCEFRKLVVFWFFIWFWIYGLGRFIYSYLFRFGVNELKVLNIVYERFEVYVGRRCFL